MTDLDVEIARLERQLVDAQPYTLSDTLKRPTTTRYGHIRPRANAGIWRNSGESGGMVGAGKGIRTPGLHVLQILLSLSHEPIDTGLRQV